MSGFTVRAAGTGDAPELARLNTAFNGASDPPETLAARLADQRLTEIALVAEQDGRIVGIAGLRLSPGLFYAEPRAELTELYVEPESRRQGIGRALAAEAERLARVAGATEFFALTGFENAEAQALYRSMDFTDRELALCKDLRPAFAVRQVNWVDLRRANAIDVSERGDVVLAWVDGELVENPYEWERPRWEPELWEQRLAGWWMTLRPDVMVGAFAGEEMVGLASLRYRLEPGTAQLTTLHVSAAYRRQGVATRLFEEIARLARSSGARRLYVSAVPTESAIGFYMRCGFRPTDEPNAELLALEPDEIHMTLTL